MRMPTQFFSLYQGEMELMLKDKMLLCFTEHHADTKWDLDHSLQQKFSGVCR